MTHLDLVTCPGPFEPFILEDGSDGKGLMLPLELVRSHVHFIQVRLQ